MRQIQLTQGQFALVDDADFEKVNQFKWKFNAGIGYAMRGGTYMHRFIIDAPKGVKVDHKNGNKLDNRKENLRLASDTDNVRNRSKAEGCTSEFKGVYRKRNKWHAAIKAEKGTVSLGSFHEEKDAALAYDVAARKYFGEFAKPNFPELVPDEDYLLKKRRAEFTAVRSGVYYDPKRGKWLVDQRVNGRRVTKCPFASEQEAANWLDAQLKQSPLE